LWAIAKRIGLDPTRNLLDDQADALSTYINERVRRAYPATDWPEWTATVERTPDTNHIVTWSDLSAPEDGSLPLERVFKVYLLDPRGNASATDIPFRLTPEGVHVGFKHGPTVWLKLIYQAPRFTATKWRGDITYSQGGLVYSIRTGNCYKSKVNNNRGNDPADSDTAEPRSLGTEQIQPFQSANPGLPVQAEILAIYFTGALLPPDPSDPPPAGTVFSFAFVDQDNNSIGSSSVTASGTDTIEDIINATVANLVGSLPGTFSVTPDIPNSKITLQDESYFTAGASFYTDSDSVDHPLRAKITQSFIPAMAGSLAVPQLVQLRLSAGDFVIGGEYSLKVRQANGTEHTVQYSALATDSTVQVLAGLVGAAPASLSAAYFEGVSFLIDPVLLTLVIGTPEAASVEAFLQPPGSAWWTRVDFPMDLVETVVEGAYGDALKEGGQNEKAGPQEQQAGNEQVKRQGTILRQSSDMLTDQQRPLSRYRIR